MSPSRQRNRRRRAKTSPLGDEVDVVEYVGHASLAIAAGLLPIPADVRRRVCERVGLTASEREEVAIAAVHMQHIHDAVDVTALNKIADQANSSSARQSRPNGHGTSRLCDGG